MALDDKNKIPAELIPTATADAVGGVKISGGNLSLAADGTLSGAYSTATASTNGSGGSAGLLAATDKEKLNNLPKKVHIYNYGPTGTHASEGDNNDIWFYYV